jgi:hypothetical protein
VTFFGPFAPAWVQKHWTQLQSSLEKLIAHEHRQGFTLPALYENMTNGTWGVWVLGNFSAVVVTQIYRQQNGDLMCSINLCGGDSVVDHAQLATDTIELYARMHGCVGIEIIGRKGWGKVVRPMGYEHYYTSVVKRF